MRRLIGLIGLAAISIAGSLAGPKQEQLVIWGLSFGPEQKGFEAVVHEFERRNPSLDVRVMSMGAGKMNPQKLMTAIVGNVAPDVINQDRFTIGDWASRGAFLPLDDLLARDRGQPDCPNPDEYYQYPWREACFGGKVYAIPAAADNRILYWNRAFFREKAAELRKAGLDPERAPKTWEELLAYSKVLTERRADGTLIRAGYLPTFGNVSLYMYSFQNEANFLSSDGRTCTMGSEPCVEALQFIRDAYDVMGGYTRAKAFETGFQTGENDAFIVGKVAMKIDGDWILNSLSRYAPDLEFSTAHPPVPKARLERLGRFKDVVDPHVSWSGGFSLAIPKGARNPEAGWKFIKFYSSLEGRLVEVRAIADWNNRIGRDYVPKQSALRTANEAIFSQYKPKRKRFADALKMHIDLMPASRIRPVTFVGQRLWDEHIRAQDNAAIGVQSPKEALLAAQKAVQLELDDYYGSKRYPLIDARIPLFATGAVLSGLLAWLIVLFRRARLGVLGRREAMHGYLFIAPWLIGFLVFTLGPMVASLFYSFTEYNVLNPARFVGGKNYASLVTTDWVNVSKALGNAVYLAGIGVPLGIVTGLAISLLLNTSVRGLRFYRTFFYMPSIVPVTAAAVLWGWILAADPNKGLLSGAWQATVSQWFGVMPPTWLSSVEWSKPALVLMGLWGAGGGMVLWLAGLKGVPSQLYEAASIDGASPTKQFWAITAPQLSPIIFFNIVTGFIGALQEFDRIYILKPSEGAVGPADSMLTPAYHLFQNGFGYFKMGYASTLAWAMFALILTLTLFQLKLAPKWVHYENET